MQILLSSTQAGPGRKVKQEQEKISRNHVPRLFLGSVHAAIVLRRPNIAHCTMCKSCKKYLPNFSRAYMDRVTSWLYWSLMLTGLLVFLHSPPDHGRARGRRRRIGIIFRCRLFGVAVNSSKVSIVLDLGLLRGVQFGIFLKKGTF